MSELQTLGLSGSSLALMGKVVFVLQIALIFHVIKTGRPYWWIFLLLGLPAVGAIAYFIVELRPGSGTFDFHAFLWSLKSPAHKLALSRQAIEEVDTVDNRVKLARECLNQHRAAEACEVLKASLQGAYVDDAYLLLEYAEALIEAERHAEADRTLSLVKPGFDRVIAQRQRMLQGRVLQGLGKLPEAVAEYRSLAAELSSEEPRYRQGCALISLGKKQEARELFLQILTKYRKNGALWRKHQKKWFALTRAKLREIPAK